MGTLILSLAVATVYWPAIDGPFVFDDAAAIVDNPSIRQLWPLVGNQENPGPLNPPEESPLATRPLVNFSFAVNYYFGGLKPRGYRVFNIVLHCLAAFLLWRVIAFALSSWGISERLEGSAESLSLTAALLWSVHPLVTESVVYVTQRTELLMGVFYFATLYCSLRYWSALGPRARPGWLALATTSCILGMLSKEMIASAPAMVLLFDRTFSAGSFRSALTHSWRLYLGLLASWLVAIFLHIGGSLTPNAGFGMGVSIIHWWLTQAQVFFLYLKLAIWPWPLVIHYEISYLTALSEAWPWLLGAGIYAIGTLYLLGRHPPLGFVFTWVVAVLSPTLVIPLVGETAAERRMYVPLAALVPLLVVGAYRLLTRVTPAISKQSTSKAIKLWALGCALGLAVGLGWLSSQRLLAYQDKVTLWGDALAHQPQNPVVLANLGCNLAEEGQLEEAIVHLREWVRLEPDSYRSHFNLALALERSKQTSGAIEHYRRSLQLQPSQAAIRYNFARVLEEQGDSRNAIRHYLKAIELQPKFTAAHTNLGLLLLEMGKADQAIKHLKNSITTLESTTGGGAQVSTTPYENLMLAYLQSGRRNEAVQTAQKASRIARNQGNEKRAEQFEADIAIIREMNQ